MVDVANEVCSTWSQSLRLFSQGLFWNRLDIPRDESLFPCGIYSSRRFNVIRIYQTNEFLLRYIVVKTISEVDT